MNIVYIAGAILPSRSAHSIQVMRMCQAFVEAGHQITLLVPRLRSGDDDRSDLFAYYGVEKSFNIQQIRLYAIKGGLLSWGLSAALKAKQLRPDLVYGRHLHGCVFAGMLRCKVILERHSPIRGTTRTILFRWLARMSHFRGLVTNSHQLADMMRNEFSLPATMVLAAPNGAEDLGFELPPSIEGELSVGYVGHLYRGRGIEMILQMANSCPWANFHIIGGTEEDIEYWRARTKDLENIHLHGFVPPSQVEQFRRSCDVLLAPYEEEVYGSSVRNQVSYMSPLKLFEYMASGRAIICSDLPALHEILAAERTALFCEPTDATSWAAALERLHLDKDFRMQLGKNAREAFLKHFTRAGRANRILEWGVK